MSRIARFLVLILLGILCVPQPTLSAVRPRDAIAVVGLYSPQQRKWRGIGTAFHLGNGLFYTNAHVVLGGQRLQREEPELQQWILVAADEFGSPRVLLGSAEIRCVDKRHQPDPYGDLRPYDAATVQLTNPQVPMPAPLPVSSKTAVVGERVSVLGFPHASVLFEMRGKIVEVAPDRIVMEREGGTAVLPGSSGSPVFNASSEIIGILQGGNVGRLTAVSVPIQTALAGCPAGNN